MDLRKNFTTRDCDGWIYALSVETRSVEDRQTEPVIFADTGARV